jgi:acyl-CoA synthetase (NDP forming)
MLKTLFEPRSVAVIGASTKEFSIGNRIVKNLVDFGFTGSIYPINPKADFVRGIRAYGSILDTPSDIDVAHIIIPSRFVPDVVEDCGRKGVKNIIINSGGFAETGAEGAALQEDFLARARKYGIRVLGPNCQGIINSDPQIRAYCNFTFTKPEPGFISIVALSGGVAEVIHQAFSEIGIGTRLYASNGNACDISIPEIIRYYGDDEKTRVIVLYVEALKDPRVFMEVANEVARKKPILAMKAGRTVEGAKAAASHTGGLAREDVSTDIIFKKTGILTFNDEADLCQAAVGFASQPIPKGNRVGMITNTGGPAVIATDVLVNEGLKIPPLSERAVGVLRERLYPESAVGNPTDVLATAEAPHFRAAMDVMMDEEQIDSVFLNFVTPFFVDTNSIAEEIVDVNRKGKKPIICNLMTDKRQWTETLNTLRKGGVPCYSFPGQAAKVLGALTRYHEIRTREAGEVRGFDDVHKRSAEDLLAEAKGAGREFLTAAEVYALLGAYGIPVADWRVAKDAAEAQQAAAEVGFPVVAKVDSEAIIHKSAKGGVALRLQQTDAVRSAVEEMRKSFEAEQPRFLIQEYLPGGLEVIVGAKMEEGLGHLIMFGIGGIYVEVLKDVVFSLAPVTTVESREILSSIKAALLLKGGRGQKGVDQEAIVEIIQRLSQLVTDHPLIREMDLNPVIAFEDRAVVVDACVRI